MRYGTKEEVRGHYVFDYHHYIEGDRWFRACTNEVLLPGIEIEFDCGRCSKIHKAVVNKIVMETQPEGSLCPFKCRVYWTSLDNLDHDIATDVFPAKKGQ